MFTATWRNIYSIDSIPIELRLKTLSATTQDVDLDALDQELIWLGTGINIDDQQQRKYKCEVCGNGVDSICQHENPVTPQRETSEEKKFQCEICGKKFRWRGYLIQHFQTHTDEKPFKCQFCERRFRRVRDRILHEFVHSDIKKYNCDQCSASFKYSQSLKAHKISHEKPKFWCNACDKYYKNKNTLRNHIALVHSDIRKHKCDQCEASFKYSQSLKAHKISHSKEKPEKSKKLKVKHKKTCYTCKTCQKKFVWLRSLRFHEIGCCASTIEDTPFICKTCGKGFKKKRNLNVHVKIAHGERLFACKICDKRFQTKMILRTHMRVHTGEKPYKCKICGMTFTYSYNLRDHESKGICNYILDDDD